MRLPIWMREIQALDLSDIVLLSMLGDQNLTALARLVYVTQPAVTQRLNKMRSVFRDDLVGDATGCRREKTLLTMRGMLAKEAAKEILKVLGSAIGSVEDGEPPRPM